MSKRSPSRHIQHQTVAVVDLGEQADYRPEVRHRISIELPVCLTSRGGIRQLNAAYQQVIATLRPALPTSRKGFHVWLLDADTGAPGLFLTGLLGVRQGRLTMPKADRMNSKIRPQITQPQRQQEYRFILNATAHAWGCAGECCDQDATDEDREYGVLDGVLGGFDHCELMDSDPSDENSIYVAGDVWHQFALDLPFTPGKGSSQTQPGYIVRKAAEQLHMEWCDIQVEDNDVWLRDESGQPKECVSGWLRAKDGFLTATDMKKWSRQVLKNLPVLSKFWAA